MINKKKRIDITQAAKVANNDFDEFFLQCLPQLLEKQKEVIRQHTWKELNELPEEYRFPLLLFYCRNMSRKEIAKCLEKKEEEIEGYFIRGRFLLKKKIELIPSCLVNLSEFEKFQKIGDAIMHLPEKDIPPVLEKKWMEWKQKEITKNLSFSYWLFLVSFSISVIFLGTLLLLNKLYERPLEVTMLVGYSIALMLVPPTFLFRLGFPQLSKLIKERIDPIFDKLDKILGFSKKRIDPIFDKLDKILGFSKRSSSTFDER